MNNVAPLVMVVASRNEKVGWPEISQQLTMDHKTNCKGFGEPLANSCSFYYNLGNVGNQQLKYKESRDSPSIADVFFCTQ